MAAVVRRTARAAASAAGVVSVDVDASEDGTAVTLPTSLPHADIASGADAGLPDASAAMAVDAPAADATAATTADQVGAPFTDAAADAGPATAASPRAMVPPVAPLQGSKFVVRELASLHGWLVQSTTTLSVDQLWVLEAELGSILRPLLSAADRSAVTDGWRAAVSQAVGRALESVLSERQQA